MGEHLLAVSSLRYRLSNRPGFPVCLLLCAEREMLRCAVARVIRLAGNSPWTGGWKAFGIVPSHPC